jgi:hypothetical protein
MPVPLQCNDGSSGCKRAAKRLAVSPDLSTVEGRAAGRVHIPYAAILQRVSAREAAAVAVAAAVAAAAAAATTAEAAQQQPQK